MLRFHPLAIAGSLLVSLPLAGCGGSSPANVVTNPVTPVPTPANIPVPTPTPTPTPPAPPAPAPVLAQYGLMGTISSPSPDFSGLKDSPVILTHGSASRAASGDQNSITVVFSNLGQNITFQLTLAKTGKIQVGDILPLTPTSASTSEYTETFNSRSAWKADSGSVRVDGITSDDVYMVSLLNVHYSPETPSSAKGAFVINGKDNLIFLVNSGSVILGQLD